MCKVRTALSRDKPYCHQVEPFAESNIALRESKQTFWASRSAAGIRPVGIRGGFLADALISRCGRLSEPEPSNFDFAGLPLVGGLPVSTFCLIAAAAMRATRVGSC